MSGTDLCDTGIKRTDRCGTCSVDSLSAIDEDTIPLRVHSSGLLTWTPPGILTVICNTDITYFPFDTQNCDIAVSSNTQGSTLSSFKAKLKTFLFSQYFHPN